MIELTPSEFYLSLPLLSGIQQKVLPPAICQGYNNGRIFMDQIKHPQAALLWSPVGYYCLAGNPANGINLPDIRHTLEGFISASLAAGETGLILLTSSPAWKAHLPVLLPGRQVIEIYRRPFSFDLARFAPLRGWRERIPAGFHLQPFDMRLAETADLPLSWESPAHFMEYGMGYALMKRDELASYCLSVFTSSERVEIDVFTAEPYRRLGLATVAGSALVEECLKRGKAPNWECFWDNHPSTALAGKLGFTPLPDYPVYYWEEPRT